MTDLAKMSEIADEIATIMIVAESYADRLKVLVEDQRRDIEQNRWELRSDYLDARATMLSDVLEDFYEVISKDLMRKSVAYRRAEIGEEEQT